MGRPHGSCRTLCICGAMHAACLGGHRPDEVHEHEVAVCAFIATAAFLWLAAESAEEFLLKYSAHCVHSQQAGFL